MFLRKKKKNNQKIPPPTKKNHQNPQITHGQYLFCSNSKEHLPKFRKFLIWWRPNMQERVWHFLKRPQYSSFSFPITAMQNTYAGEKSCLFHRICSNIYANRQQAKIFYANPFSILWNNEVRCINSKQTKRNFKLQSENPQYLQSSFSQSYRFFYLIVQVFLISQFVTAEKEKRFSLFSSSQKHSLLAGQKVIIY